jgi:hypothetical protein
VKFLQPAIRSLHSRFGGVCFLVATAALAIAVLVTGMHDKSVTPQELGSASNLMVSTDNAKQTAPKLACNGAPLKSEADHDFTYKPDGTSTLDTYSVADLPVDPDFMTVKPEADLPEHGVYRFTISPFVKRHISGGHLEAYAAFTGDDGFCHSENLIDEPDVLTVPTMIDGESVPWTALSFTLPPGAALDYIVINVDDTDPTEPE